MLRVERLKKVFRSGESDFVLFENLSFEVKRGEMLAIVGESGAGKSTLLHILSALDQASAGDVYCANLRVNSLSHDEAADFRNRETGFVWQFHYLLPEFTAAENVAMPLLCGGERGSRSNRRLCAGCARWDWSSGRTIVPVNFPAVNSSGSRWLVRSSLGPSCCSPMSRRGTWTDRRRKRFSLSLRDYIASINSPLSLPHIICPSPGAASAFCGCSEDKVEEIEPESLPA